MQGCDRFTKNSLESGSRDLFYVHVVALSEDFACHHGTVEQIGVQ